MVGSQKLCLYQNTKLILESTTNLNLEDLKNLSQKLLKKEPNSIVFISNQSEEGIILMGMSGRSISLKSDINIGNIVSKTVKHFDGKGGGKNDFGQGFITKKGISLVDIIQYIKENYFRA